MNKAKNVISQKDAVILAEAKMARPDLLVTLDKKDFLQERVARFLKPTIALTPKMLFDVLKTSRGKATFPIT